MVAQRQKRLQGRPVSCQVEIPWLFEVSLWVSVLLTRVDRRHRSQNEVVRVVHHLAVEILKALRTIERSALCRDEVSRVDTLIDPHHGITD